MCKITKFHSNTVTVTLTKLYHIKQDHFIVNFYILLEKCKKSQYLNSGMTRLHKMWQADAECASQVQF